MKIENSTSNIFVKKISERSDEFLTKDEILRIWMLSGGSKSRLSYALSMLLGKKRIESISQWLYRIQDDENKRSGIQDDYWHIVEKLIKLHAPWGWIIGWEKALEMHLQNLSIPDILIIYTRDIAKRIRLSDGRQLHFRTLISWEKSGKKNLFRLLQMWSMSLDWKCSYLSHEGALLDALSLRMHETWVEESNIIRFLKNFHKDLKRDSLGDLVKYRYIRAINRLRVIARDNGYEDLYKKTLDIIRDEGGGCYVNI